MRQKELDKFRNELGLSKWKINENTQAPFMESLREYVYKNPVERMFHCEMTYHENGKVEVLMTFMNSFIRVSGIVQTQSFEDRDELNEMQDIAAKKLKNKFISKNTINNASQIRSTRNQSFEPKRSKP